MTLLADVASPWRYDGRLSIRRIFRAGQLAAALDHDRTDCPHPGNTATSRVTRKRSARSQKHLSDRRQAWLAGYDGQRKAMRCSSTL